MAFPTVLLGFEMADPETPQENRNRCLRELEGKNISHYSVMLSAYINSRIDVNKAIFTLASAAIGFLIAAFNEPFSATSVDGVLYALSMVAFVTAVISTLFIHVSHTKAINAYIRNENEKQRDFELTTWIYVNYVAFGIGVLLAAILAVYSTFE